MKYSIIIPVYNEEYTIKQIINAINKINLDKEIIVINDGSSDNTANILKEINQSNLIKLTNNTNKGKGYSLRKGIALAQGEIIIPQDGDLELNPQDYYLFDNMFNDKKIQIVYGNRYPNGYSDKGIGFLSAFANYFLTKIANILFRSHIDDVACGYKCFRSSILKEKNIVFKTNGFEICFEMTAKFARNGFKIYNLPVHFIARNYKNGKKIHWKDGFRALFTLLKYRFVK